jgi:hypothetical protein
MFNSRLLVNRAPIVQRLVRSIHTVNAPLASKIGSEEPVLVYQAKEHKELKAASGHNWDGNLMSSAHKAKFFGLVPFFVESYFADKSFVLQMNFYPEAKTLAFDVLKLDGVHTVHVPLTNLVPITKYDYWAVSWKFWTKQNQLLDLDMIYANRSTKHMYLFDKDGEWHDEGVYHEGLNMDSTYNETNWYDEFSAHNF